MEQGKIYIKKKGGRPKKAVKRNQLLGVKCSPEERQAIKTKAGQVNLSISEYLREMGLTGKIDMRQKTLPPEVLQLTAILNHDAANLNQIAKKRNGIEELNALERADLQVLSNTLKRLVAEIRNYLK